MQHRNFILYILVLVSSVSIVLIALGGGLFGQQQPWMVQWQHQALQRVCHQIPQRSFWIFGQPMAVCSRCFGIYTGFTLGWIGLPLLARLKLFSSVSRKQLLIGAVLINLADLVGNFLGFWQNTLISRLILGEALGLAVAVLFLGSFFNKKIKINGTHHGRIRTTEI